MSDLADGAKQYHADVRQRIHGIQEESYFISNTQRWPGDGGVKGEK